MLYPLELRALVNLRQCLSAGVVVVFSAVSARRQYRTVLASSRYTWRSATLTLPDYGRIVRHLGARGLAMYSMGASLTHVCVSLVCAGVRDYNASAKCLQAPEGTRDLSNHRGTQDPSRIAQPSGVSHSTRSSGCRCCTDSEDYTASPSLATELRPLRDTADRTDERSGQTEQR